VDFFLAKTDKANIRRRKAPIGLGNTCPRHWRLLRKLRQESIRTGGKMLLRLWNKRKSYGILL